MSLGHRRGNNDNDNENNGGDDKTVLLLVFFFFLLLFVVVGVGVGVGEAEAFTGWPQVLGGTYGGGDDRVDSMSTTTPCSRRRFPLRRRRTRR